MTTTTFEDTPTIRTRPSTLFPIGLPLYLLSFTLPAIDVGQGAPIVGWQVALTTLHFPEPLLLFSGLVNPILVLYSLLHMTGCARGLRRVLACAAVCLIPVSWVTMWLFHCGIQIGHLVWVLGIGLMSAGEIRDAFRRNL